MIQPKEKAVELVNKFKPMVFCYRGSGMLTNEYDEGVATQHAKDCAIVAVDELFQAFGAYEGMYYQEFFDSERIFWLQVRNEIELIPTTT